MNCEQRGNTALYVDGELEPAAQQAFAGHLENCAECSAAVLEQQELKKAVRVAGKKFSAPPELYAAAHRNLAPRRSRAWWKLAMAPLAVLLLALITYLAIPRRSVDAMISGVVNQHLTTMASTTPVDIVNSSHHVVKPWFIGRLPFTFNMPELAGTDYQLIGGKQVFVDQRPGAQLLYQAGRHKVSIFIFQSADTGLGTRSPRWNHDLTFTVGSWTAGGRECYLVTDGNQNEADKLATMFQEANRS
ncbi:MAG TPA: zf-HC2 domain-containing protein [Candidatus Angelobacter sp.]|nr:zf-HC2 domain-containing protein [Candidatus Angelobacter sp.]